MKPRHILFLPIITLLAACGSLAPGGPAPEAPVSQNWKSVTGDIAWINAEISADARQQWQSGEWWRLFGDAALDDLMPQVAVGNQNLAQMVANVAEAEALLRQAESARWPVLGVNFSTGRSGKPAVGSAAASVSASWSPDLWGDLADAVRAQKANVEASQADLAAAQLSAQGSFAQGYFTVREADAELALLDDIIKGYLDAEKMTQNRYDAGIAAHTDLLQAQSTLASAHASREQLAASRAVTEHALALLLGQPPASFSLPPADWSPVVPPIPAALPSDLLLRRPDIASSERAVAAANANIGVARGAYFPSIGLTGSAGRTASRLSELLSAPARVWSLGLSLAETLFDGGARGSQLDLAWARHAAATASYRQTALTAIGQVEDNLTQLAAQARQIEQTRIAAEAAEGAACA
ncbi:MAG: efflux transporter outer membrane subunit [Azonexus sp.]|jgi:NodT family efflux transporter outer membrane factor (OMF) lipoprotein|nr:efflux transporter outer membrane subunit [Azonexus sp.]